MLTLLAIGLWPWIGILILCTLVIVGIEMESGAGTLAGLVGGSVLLYLLTHGWTIPTFSAVVHWVDANMLVIFAYAGLYVFLGAVWGLIKWWFYLHNEADDYARRRDEIQKLWNDFSVDVQKSYGDYKDWVRHRYEFPPSPLKNKARITMWMIYWPWSALWTLLNDPIKHIYRFVYQQLTTTYQRMANFVFASRFAELG